MLTIGLSTHSFHQTVHLRAIDWTEALENFFNKFRTENLAIRIKIPWLVTSSYWWLRFEVCNGILVLKRCLFGSSGFDQMSQSMIINDYKRNLLINECWWCFRTVQMHGFVESKWGPSKTMDYPCDCWSEELVSELATELVTILGHLNHF